jgi:AMMECR1 domain-containing protein
MGSPLAAFPWRPLRRALNNAQRTKVRSNVAALLRWQRDLERWPRCKGLPDATPFVSLYAAGRLCGCIGSDEGAPGERVARAFVQASADVRYGGIAPDERDTISAQVSYARNPRRTKAKHVLEMLEMGTHGVAMAWSEQPGAPQLLLPQVARDEGLSAEQMVQTLAIKSGLDEGAWRDAEIIVFETDDVVVQLRTSRKKNHHSATDLAARWLATLIHDDGSITFAIDGRRRQHHAVGLMHHGRTALVIQALAAHRRAPKRVARARNRLATDIGMALKGRLVSGWPDEPAMAVGTVALACLAGAKLMQPLSELVRSTRGIERHAWYAAQAVIALGKAAPPKLWRACVADLKHRPWAPWTAMAAHIRHDRAVYARCEKPLIDSIATTAPHVGGALVSRVPECAQTAVVAEALRASKSAAGRRAAKRARDFLLRWQLTPQHIPAALDAAMVTGAFPLSPVIDIARCDVTAHALLALA